MGWREILGVAIPDKRVFSEKSNVIDDINNLNHFNPKGTDHEEIRFEWMERAAIMEFDGGLSREIAEKMAYERVYGKRTQKKTIDA